MYWTAQGKPGIQTFAVWFMVQVPYTVYLILQNLDTYFLILNLGVKVNIGEKANPSIPNWFKNKQDGGRGLIDDVHLFRFSMV
ncbi:MAG: hypothetical protein CM1200mP23_0110 [Nitrososphaerota archaeon]|nr:MAG: hypothetical protein CM1200mP23_0110 [Nitrososphaerota archaeon]